MIGQIAVAASRLRLNVLIIPRLTPWAKCFYGFAAAIGRTNCLTKSPPRVSPLLPLTQRISGEGLLIACTFPPGPPPPVPPAPHEAIDDSGIPAGVQNIRSDSTPRWSFARRSAASFVMHDRWYSDWWTTGTCFFDHPTFYLSQPHQILYFWQGGNASHGALVGIMTALTIYCRWKSISFVWLSDRLCVGIPLSAAMVRLGNFTNSEIPCVLAGAALLLASFYRQRATATPAAQALTSPM